MCHFPPLVDGRDQTRITVFKRDMCRLEEGNKLNDSLVEFYLKCLHMEKCKTEECKAEECYFFSTYFLASLVQVRVTVRVKVRVMVMG
jgi:Ulp1 family protease